jgi:hypothetical protein
MGCVAYQGTVLFVAEDGWVSLTLAGGGQRAIAVRPHEIVREVEEPTVSDCSCVLSAHGDVLQADADCLVHGCTDDRHEQLVERELDGRRG